MATYTSNYGWTKPSGSDNVDISVLNDNLDDQDSTIHDAFLNMASPFSESSTYAVDDIVLYGTKLYKCHTAVVSPGSWTGSTNWQVYKISDEIANKVDKVAGKGLSTNDYTNTDKAEVAKVANKADKTATASGETLALVPTSEGRALLHTAYGMSTQSGTPTPSSPVDIVSAKADLRSVGKNLIPYPYYETTHTESGVTFTDNGDGTITVSTDGKGATADAIFIIINYNTDFAHTYNIDIDEPLLLSGCPTGGGSGTYYIQLGLSNGSIVWAVSRTDYGNGQRIDLLPGFSIYNISVIRIVIKSGQVCNNLVFKPMLRLADVTDNTYEPYTKHDLTTDLTLRAIEVTSSDAYNLVRDGKYYIADTLDYSDDNGFVVTRRVGVVNVNAASWYKDWGNDVAQFNFTPTALATTLKAYCNRFIRQWQSAPNTNEFWVANTGGFVFIIVDSSITSISTATDWLTNNPTYVVYALRTPITESITTAQALALLGLKTYDESTSISSQAEPSCTIAVEYAKERLGALALTAYNTAKGNDLRITALES